MNTKFPIAASAILVAVALTLTGCSAGGLPGAAGGGGASGPGTGSSGGPGGSGGSGANGPTKNYDSADLVAVLKKVEASRNLSGSIEGDSEIKADEKSLGSDTSLTKTLTAAGGTFEPAACGTLLDSLVADGTNALAESSWTSASLDATSDIIDVGSTTDVAGANAIMSKVEGVMNQVASQCGTMKIVEAGTSVAFSIKKVSASTKASSTFAYEEDITIPGSKQLSKTFTIEATYGNLFVADVAVAKGDIPTMEANVNAVIDAANG